MNGEQRFCFLRQITAALLIGLWPLAWSAHGWATDRFFPTGESELERVIGPVRQATVTTKNSITTLLYSPTGALTRKEVRNRSDSSDDPGETTLYRYDSGGRKVGEYIKDSDGEVIPLRLLAYNDEQRIAAEAAYHMCRTFSSLHMYAYDRKSQLIEDLQFESRRLTRRAFEYDAKGEVDRVITERNGRLMTTTRYTYDDAGRVATAAYEQPDGSVVRRLYYDERGNVIMLVETHPRDSARDKTEITTYEYDQHGNWTRRTIIRAVNPLDEEGLPIEEPVEVINREIIYADSSAQ
jgi:YD repeat-containing protein